MTQHKNTRVPLPIPLNQRDEFVVYQFLNQDLPEIETTQEPEKSHDLVFWGILLVLILAIHSWWLSAKELGDDWHHVMQIIEVRDGKLPFKTWILDYHNEHLIPLWKALCYAQFTLFGRNYVFFRLLILLSHWISSICVYLLCKHYSPNIWVARSSAFLWGTVGLGSWENPFVWVAASHLSFGFMFILVGMVCLTRFQSKNTQQNWMTLLFLIIAQALALSTMAAMLLFSFMQYLQLTICDYVFQASWKKQVLWTFVLLILPVLVAGYLYKNPPVKNPQSRGENNLIIGFRMSVMLFLCSLGRMVFPFGGIGWAFVAGTVCLLPAFGTGINWISTKGISTYFRFCLVVFAGIFIYTFIACYFRSSWPETQIWGWGRYRYTPTLFWTLVAGGVIGTFLSFAKTHWNSPGKFKVVVVTLMLFYMTVQSLNAREARLQFDDRFQDGGPNFDYLFGPKDQQSPVK